MQRTSFRAYKISTMNLKVNKIQDKREHKNELRDLQSRWKGIESLHIQIDNILQGSHSQCDDEFYAHEASYKAIK